MPGTTNGVWRIAVTRPGEYPNGEPVKAKRYLTQAGAEHRAALIREHGGECTVERSRPVQWPSAPDRRQLRLDDLEAELKRLRKFRRDRLTSRWGIRSSDGAFVADYGWRRVSPNGRTISHGEGHTRPSDAERAALRACPDLTEANLDVQWPTATMVTNLIAEAEAGTPLRRKS